MCRIACGPDCLGADSLHCYITNWRTAFDNLARSAVLLGWRDGGRWSGGADWQVVCNIWVPILCIATSKIGAWGVELARVDGIVLGGVWQRRIACGPDCLGADSLHVYITNWQMGFDDLAHSAILLGWRGGGGWFGGTE